MYGRKTPKIAGHVWITPEFGPVIEYDTMMCAHCQMHFTVIPGSGRRRGFCMRCGHVTCGQAKCDACVPFEQWLENVEAGRAENFRPIIVGT